LKKILYIFIAATVFIFNGCGDKKVDNPNIQNISSLTNEITVGKKLQNITLNDQFDKPVSLISKTKKIVFVFKKASGHTARGLLDSKPDDYLLNKNVAFIADISGMPSIIASMFAIPDFKKHKYPVMLIKDEDAAKKYKNEKYEDYITIVGLNNFKITSITLVSTATQLEKILN